MEGANQSVLATCGVLPLTFLGMHERVGSGNLNRLSDATSDYESVKRTVFLFRMR